MCARRGAPLLLPAARWRPLLAGAVRRMDISPGVCVGREHGAPTDSDKWTGSQVKGVTGGAIVLVRDAGSLELY